LHRAQLQAARRREQQPDADPSRALHQEHRQRPKSRRPDRAPGEAPSTKVDYECELAIVIGRACKNVSQADALDYVLGYTCANDVSARDWQRDGGGGQWCQGKSFDTFCPLGPVLVTRDEIPNPTPSASRPCSTARSCRTGTRTT
jgi:2-keto-4-pentenoate hydratase/2-oxohepta-3-ene-1,7-dioic acid hydratase in catechol pathway